LIPHGRLKTLFSTNSIDRFLLCAATALSFLMVVKFPRRHVS
jgi:hypothetical protein